MSESVQDSIQEITPSEWELMRIVWTKGKIYSRELIDLMQAKRSWSDSTIKTLLRRLVKKGLLKTEKEDRRFRYTATISETEAMNGSAEQLFDHLCAMKKGATLLNLVDHVTLTQKDIQNLQAVLAEKAKSAPTEVDCDCLPDNAKCD
ncbi:CopY/TcrY family copper transport repressor [Lactobacillus sp. LC28-10]|uniref:CopY/TcrY family copper transport repressor n=1 Tax=Secundilactobacillus angelensis TaxID=2722706 RepID=A0ABX1KWL1_9LACO|nr:CopY/TcrY family copper transport repressor [Secundilactobacillus angelensis]MCH5463436.1 CopY/TcrY family copper transport repressor [Secundilactobacillus angelensis]NLR18329.1 CopY/TcrY family copper transport repressor [Secundilactobacillus angelensis]